MNPQDIRIKRIYEAPSQSDGRRVLVDRLWPRGVSKEEARLDEWLKEVAPSSELRRWFDHDPEKFEEFRKRYETELAEKEEAVELLESAAEEDGTLTLLYAAKDGTHNHAVVLRDFLRRRANSS